jgi:hypothetical protein
MTLILVIFSKTIDWRFSVKKFLYIENYLSTSTKVISAQLKNISFNLEINLGRFELIHIHHLKILILILIFLV